MINQLTIRHELHPERRCNATADTPSWTPPRWVKCGRAAEFAFDAPGEVCENLCHYHARKRIVDLIDQMHAEALRDHDQQTTRLQLLGKPCRICGVRREKHANFIPLDTYPDGCNWADHEWADDEDDAEAYEREKK